MSDKPKVVYIEMTDERKEHWKRVSAEVVDLLRHEFDSPIEAGAILRFMMESFENVYGIEETFSLKNGIQ